MIRHPFPAPPAEGEALRIAPGVLWLRLPLPLALDHVNCYAFEEDGGWSLVDPGMRTGRALGLWERLLAGPLGGRPVRRVIATHHHPDHIGMAGWFRARGAEIVTTRTAWLSARMLVLDVQARPLPETLAFWRAAGMPAAMLAARAQARPFNFADCVAPLPPGYTRIAEGGRLRLGGRDWRVRCGEGHAPEHATLWEADGPLVIGGDQLLPGISANLSVYPSEPEADPVAQWLASARRLAPHARADHLVLPGHKLPFTGLPLRLRQMAENHESALARLRAHLAAPRTACECFGVLFRREIGEGEYGLALGEAVAHLNHLRHKGQIGRETDGEGRWLWQAIG